MSQVQNTTNINLSVAAADAKPVAEAPKPKIAFRKKSVAGQTEQETKKLAMKPAAEKKQQQPVESNFLNVDEHDLIECATRASSQAEDEGHALAHTWSIWEKTCCGMHDEDETTYKKNCKAIKTFDTIEAFMEIFNGVPAPSEIINNKDIVRDTFDYSQKDFAAGKVGERKNGRRGSILGAPPKKVVKQIDAISFFRDNINPTWEDKAHHKGGLFQFTFKSDFPMHAMDEVWERLLFSILGNSIPNGEGITGIRMADRRPGALCSVHEGAAVAVRLEVWHTELSKDAVSELRKECMNIMKEPLSCGGIAKNGRTVHKGSETTKTAFVYQKRKVENDEEPRRGSV